MEKNIKQQFAENIIFYRKQKGLSQEELAFIAGIDRSYMSRIERGIVSIGIENIAKISKALDLEPWVLLKCDN